MSSRLKRIAFVGDFHCGHRAGLTPPQWRFRECSEEHVWKKFTKVQEECWNHYAKIVRLLRPITCLVVNGDDIDGRGEKSGGVELMTGDRNEQSKMAIDCIKPWDAPEILMTTGTPYHAGDIESFEHVIAEQLRTDGHKVKIGDHEWLDVNGYVFDIKHHISSSAVPYGRLTALGRDEVWNALWAEAGNQPRANMIVRSHVHFCVGGYRYSGGKKREFMTLPALQAMGTRFGARRCSGTVDWGVVAFDVDSRGRIVCRHEYVTQIEATVAKAHRI